MDYLMYLSIGTAVALIAHAVRATWHLRGLETDIRKDVDANIENVQRDIARLDREALERAETLRHEFGETGAALRNKIHEVETWNRDTFVRRESFDAAITRIEKSMERGFDKVDTRIAEAIQVFSKRD